MIELSLQLKTLKNQSLLSSWRKKVFTHLAEPKSN